MPKVSVKTRESAKAVELPEGFSGDGQAAAYFAGSSYPLRLHRFDLAAGNQLAIAADEIDRLAYVWRGTISAGGHRLGEGSSLIVERGQRLDVVATEGPCVLLAFSAAQPTTHPLAGGHVHLLPAEKAPRTESLGGSPGLGGVMHSDADCPTCMLWLHENHFPGRAIPRTDDEAGIHSHSEDEIVFVIDGEICLGARLFGPGTAVAIAAETLYSFTAGPKGLKFINFRAGKPGDIRFAKGPSISETQYWRDRLPRPSYLSPAN